MKKTENTFWFIPFPAQNEFFKNNCFNSVNK